MNKKIGFLGCGNMGSAIALGICNSGLTSSSNVLAYVKTDESKARLRNKGLDVKDSIKDLVEVSDYIVLGVKPVFVKGVLEEAKPYLNNKAVISIVAGATTSLLTELVGDNVRLIRTMPNTPAQVGSGMTILCSENSLTDTEKADVESIFNSVGSVAWLEERLIDQASALSGCSPAFVAMFVEALADGGVLEGIPRKTAYELVEKSVLGSAKMLLDLDLHPAKLKDMVCSPGGTTIEGVKALELGGLRYALMDCVSKVVDKNKKLI